MRGNVATSRPSLSHANLTKPKLTGSNFNKNRKHLTMANRCKICNVYSDAGKASGLSFHRFPADPIKRNIWISVLGLSENVNITKSSYICSKHFSKDDFVSKIGATDNARYLKRDAVSLPMHQVFEPKSTTRIRVREAEPDDVDANPEDGWRTKTFTWQAKHFSKIERDFYGDVNNCLTDIEKIYNEKITNESEEDEEAGEGGISLFTYVNDEGYVADHETVRSNCVSYLEKITAQETEENQLQSYDDYHKSLCESMLQPTLVENSEKMYIMADFGEYTEDIWTANERLLCTIKFDKTSRLLSIYPDFTTTQPYSMRIQEKNMRHIFYYIENASDLGQGSDAPTDKEEIQKVEPKVCDDFTMPPRDKMFAYVFFEILSGEGFENDDIFVRYIIDLGEDWTCDCPDVLTGITQRCRSSPEDGLTHFGHHFDVVLQYDIQNFQENSAPKNPLIYFEMISRGTWDRHTTEGLTRTALLVSKPGCYAERLSCFRVTRRGPSGDLRRFFIGDHLDYDNIKWTGLSETSVVNIYNVDTVSTGWLEIRFNVVCQSQAFLHEFSERDQKEKLIYEKLNSSSLIRSVNQVLLAFKKAKKNLADARKDILEEK